MRACWSQEAEDRPSFKSLASALAEMLRANELESATSGGAGAAPWYRASVETPSSTKRSHVDAITITELTKPEVPEMGYQRTTNVVSI